jgi:hypothetical protein
VRATINWLRRAFDQSMYPWFAEEFVDPALLTNSQMDSQVIPLFDHLVDVPF